MVVTEKSLWGIKQLSARWADISPCSIRRLIDKGELGSVTVGARRFVPFTEIQRAEQYGVGTPRKARNITKGII
jgi:hypothetical protein